jgi:hypothetical protein
MLRMMFLVPSFLIAVPFQHVKAEARLPSCHNLDSISKNKYSGLDTRNIHQNGYRCN